MRDRLHTTIPTVMKSLKTAISGKPTVTTLLLGGRQRLTGFAWTIISSNEKVNESAKNWKLEWPP